MSAVLPEDGPLRAVTCWRDKMLIKWWIINVWTSHFFYLKMLCDIWGFRRSDYEEYCFWVVTHCSQVENYQLLVEPAASFFRVEQAT